MSDYGFATYDKGGKKRLGSINSKWPIFGPRYKDIGWAFKTLHIVDTASYGFRTADLSEPIAGGNTSTGFYGNEKIPIATVPHGLGKRPLGYATISGGYMKNVRGRWAYDERYDPYDHYPSSTTLTGTGVYTGNMIGNMQGEGVRYYETNMSGDYSVLTSNYFSMCNISYPNMGNGWFLSNNIFPIPGENSSTQVYDKSYYPYYIEVDDRNVYIYRCCGWCDVWKRSYQAGERDLLARMQGVVDYAGSDFNVTLYFCPYSMEDLI